MITVSRLYKINKGSTLKAFADVVINEQVLIKGVQVLSSKENGLFVSMPKQKSKNDKWYETVSLLDEDVKEDLQVVVLKAYNSDA